MKTLKVILIVGVVILLGLSLAWSAPKDKDKENNGQGQEKQELKEEARQSNDNQGKRNEHIPEAAAKQLTETPSHEVNNIGKEQAHLIREGAIESGVDKTEKKDSSMAKEKQEKNTLNDAKTALEKLENSRWAYNPNDTRGQGNMGQVAMIAPYGHDKDSDRMELYGNRGRVIRPEPTPTPTPEPEPTPAPQPEPTPTPTPEPEPTPAPQPEPTPTPTPTPEPTPTPTPEPEPTPAPQPEPTPTPTPTPEPELPPDYPPF